MRGRGWQMSGHRRELSSAFGLLSLWSLRRSLRAEQRLRAPLMPISRGELLLREGLPEFGCLSRSWSLWRRKRDLGSVRCRWQGL